MAPVVLLLMSHLNQSCALPEAGRHHEVEKGQVLAGWATEPTVGCATTINPRLELAPDALTDDAFHRWVAEDARSGEDGACLRPKTPRITGYDMINLRIMSGYNKLPFANQLGFGRAAPLQAWEAPHNIHTPLVAIYNPRTRLTALNNPLLYACAQRVRQLPIPMDTREYEQLSADATGQEALAKLKPFSTEHIDALQTFWGFYPFAESNAELPHQATIASAARFVGINDGTTWISWRNKLSMTDDGARKLAFAELMRLSILKWTMRGIVFSEMSREQRHQARRRAFWAAMLTKRLVLSGTYDRQGAPYTLESVLRDFDHLWEREGLKLLELPFPYRHGEHDNFLDWSWADRVTQTTGTDMLREVCTSAMHDKPDAITMERLGIDCAMAQ